MICRFCKSIAIVRLSDKYTKCLTCGAVNSAKVDKVELDKGDDDGSLNKIQNKKESV